MLEKSLSSPADSIAYDLEDSVSSNKKREARKAVAEHLNLRPHSQPIMSCLQIPFRGRADREGRWWCGSMLVDRGTRSPTSMPWSVPFPLLSHNLLFLFCPIRTGTDPGIS